MQQRYFLSRGTRVPKDFVLAREREIRTTLNTPCQTDIGVPLACLVCLISFSTPTTSRVVRGQGILPANDDNTTSINCYSCCCHCCLNFNNCYFLHYLSGSTLPLLQRTLRRCTTISNFSIAASTVLLKVYWQPFVQQTHL